MIRYLDMFAGIGGFRSALERVGGFKCVAYCEIDKYAKKAYEAMYDTEGEIYFNDARQIDPEELPDIDLICGGFPCQTFSIAGKRAGFKDTRGTLFFEIARIAAVKSPEPGQAVSHDRSFLANELKIVVTCCVLKYLKNCRQRYYSGYSLQCREMSEGQRVVAPVRSESRLLPPQRMNELASGSGQCLRRLSAAGRVLSFTGANPKTLVQRVPGKQGDRIYSIFGLSITLTSQAGGFAGKTGLYEIMGLPIKSKTKSGYQVAIPGDSIDLSYADMNTRRGRVGRDIAHTLTTSNTQGYYFVYCIDLNPQPKITDLARCITTRQDNGIGKRKGEKSGVIFISAEPIAVLTPDRESKRQEGRRFKLPGEPMFTITVADRHA